MGDGQQSYLGVSGGGVMLSLRCPCQVVRMPNGGLVLTGQGAMVEVSPGGDIVAPHGAVEDLIMRVDRGVSAGPWTLIVPRPGFVLDLPLGVVVMSGTDDNPLPELHPAKPGSAATVPDVFVHFGVARRDASEIQVRGDHDIDERTITFSTEHGDTHVRVWEYGYELAGVSWRKRHYALALVPGVTVMMSGQAPQTETKHVFALCDELAASFASMHETSQS